MSLLYILLPFTDEQEKLNTGIVKMEECTEKIGHSIVVSI
jgi:hypothetical protein